MRKTTYLPRIYQDEPVGRSSSGRLFVQKS
jgi:hypothetical protein